METATLAARERYWPRLDLRHVLLFFGAITASVASISILDEVPESSSDVWVLVASLGFFAAYALAAIALDRRGLATPSGLMALVSATMVPAVAFAITQLIGVYPKDADPLSDFSGALLTIGVATTLAALVAFALTGFTFTLALLVAHPLPAVNPLHNLDVVGHPLVGGVEFLLRHPVARLELGRRGTRLTGWTHGGCGHRLASDRSGLRPDQLIVTVHLPVVADAAGLGNLVPPKPTPASLRAVAADGHCASPTRGRSGKCRRGPSPGCVLRR
jgi:hypothetical protein